MEFISLVDFIFETNPLQKPDIDQCITAICQPLEIIYDAVSCEIYLFFIKEEKSLFSIFLFENEEIFPSLMNLLSIFLKIQRFLNFRNLKTKI